MRRLQMFVCLPWQRVRPTVYVTLILWCASRWCISWCNEDSDYFIDLLSKNFVSDTYWIQCLDGVSISLCHKHMAAISLQEKELVAIWMYMQVQAGRGPLKKRALSFVNHHTVMKHIMSFAGEVTAPLTIIDSQLWKIKLKKFFMLQLHKISSLVCKRVNSSPYVTYVCLQFKCSWTKLD
jgi:hypothetical protein